MLSKPMPFTLFARLPALNIKHRHLSLNNVHSKPSETQHGTSPEESLMFKLAKSLFRRQPWPQLRFPSSGFEVVSDTVLFEEEQLEEFQRGVYYPVKIGDVFASKYQVVGKLGFGVTSTVWLARDLK